ncbi:uncharacterized protein LOC116293253 [Actinia tenebrosa]|uniref:Uncharacterized protein LOC116293253 n=1 Tax=Actinia tenebrosa TaxID=6105 RepID=A0A6P8HJF5_ACTTE|nr:uncharacterized protein LOC116293253 [Actinia tenebrosa]
MALNECLKVRKGKKHHQDQVFTVLERENPIDEEIRRYVQLQVVAVGELFDMDNLYIVCEGMILCVIPHKRIIDAILALLASFYIFNMEYKEGSNILSFLEQALLGISRGKPRITVSAFFNSLTSA